MQPKILTNTPAAFEKFIINKQYKITKIGNNKKKIQVIDPNEIKNISLSDILKGQYQIYRSDSQRKHVSITKRDEIESYLNDNTLVDRQYQIVKLDSDGKQRKISDKNEIHKILHTDYLKGSIAFTRDTRHKGFLHVIIHIVQWVHSRLWHRTKNLDVNLCHGIIITGKGISDKARPNPFMIAHGVFEGIRTANRDYLVEYDVTQLVIYKPVDNKVCELVKKHAELTAYIKNPLYRTEKSPKQKCPFSIADMFLCFFFNEKHRACEKRRPVPKSAILRTANLLTDFILEQEILNRRNKPKALFCSPYAMIVLQGSFMMRHLDNVDTLAKNAFLRDTEGRILKRNDLSKKVADSLMTENKKNAFAQAIYNTYHQNKIARLDGRFMMSAYIAKVLDKMSLGK